MITDYKQSLISDIESIHRKFISIHYSSFSDQFKRKNVQRANLYRSSIEMVDLVLKCIIVGSKSFNSDRVLRRAQLFLISYISEMDGMNDNIKITKLSSTDSYEIDIASNELQQNLQKSELDDLLCELKSRKNMKKIESPLHDSHSVHYTLFDDLDRSVQQNSNRKRSRSRMCRKNTYNTLGKSTRASSKKQKAMIIHPEYDNADPEELEVFFNHIENDQDEDIGKHSQSIQYEMKNKIAKVRYLDEKKQNPDTQNVTKNKNIDVESEDTMNPTVKYSPNKQDRTTENEEFKIQKKTNDKEIKPLKTTENIQNQPTLILSQKILDKASSAITRLHFLCSSNQLDLPEFVFERVNNLFVCSTKFLDQRFRSRHVKTRMEAKNEICEYIIHFCSLK